MIPVILYLVSLLSMLALGSPAWAVDLTITVTANAGAETTEVQVIGGGVKLDDPNALYRTLINGDLSVKILGTTIDKAFPGTDYVCMTARKKGDTKWWLDAAGHPQCYPWPTSGPVVVVPPPVEPPPVEPPPVTQPAVTKADLDALVALMAETDKRVTEKAQALVQDLETRLRAENKALLKQQLQGLASSLEGCERKPNAGPCFKALRDALKGVNP